MEYDEIDWLRRQDRAWRLLRADHAPLVLRFLGQVFVDDNVRSISGDQLAERLDDTLFALNEQYGEATFPRSARAYLGDWADAGWLRRYYPPDSDEVHFDATPAVERALAWVRSLQAREFIGTESRLNIAVDLLRQMAFGAETDPDARLEELQRRRGEIDAEIARVRAGEFTVLDDAAQRDRYQQFVATARSLLGDLREVEENFRALDRRVRERIAAWQGSKGELLDEIVGGRHAISGSDQGRSFDAFYDFLLSMRRQEEFTDLLERVQTLDAIGQVDQRITRVQHDWLNAAGRTQSTVRLLSEQLRRFLDDQAWLENRRVMDVLRSIEAHALIVRDGDTSMLKTSIDDTKVEVVLPMERPLYQPRARHAVDSVTVDGPAGQVDMSALFEQVYVDPARLIAAVRDVLREQSQVPLRDVVVRHPLKEGLAELVAYLSLDDGQFTVVFDEARRESITWTDSAGGRRTVTAPTVTFVRAGEGIGR
jgi:flagellar motility protein MotE (MotC chaperone)